MSFSYHLSSYRLIFKKPAGTSRGTYVKRDVWYIILSSDQYPGRVGIGECAPLPQLSCDDLPDYENILHEQLNNFCQVGQIDYDVLRPYPSMLFGIETALLHLQSGNYAFHPSDFGEGRKGIPINGLIWMGNQESMLRQIEAKLQGGFTCIKLKIGAIDFDEELDLIRFIRSRYSASQV